MGANTWPKWRHKGESGKWATQMCTRPTPGHHLAFLIHALIPGSTLTWNNQLNEFTWAPSNKRTEQVYMGALKWTIQTSLHGWPQMTQTREFTWEMTSPNEIPQAPSNNPPEWFYIGALKWPSKMCLHGKWRYMGEFGKWIIRTCTKPTPGHKLVFLTRTHVPGCTLTKHDSTHPNEFTRAPSHDLTLRNQSSLHGHPHMTRPNPHKRVYMGTHNQPKRRHKGELGK